MSGSWGRRLSISIVLVCSLVLILGTCSPAMAAAGASRGVVVPQTTTAPVLVRPVITTITTETTQPAVTCQAPCQCLSRSDAISKWGETGFIQCSESPCVTPARTTAGCYCYQKKIETVSPASLTTVSPVTAARVATSIVPVQPHPEPSQPPAHYQIPSQLTSGIHIETNPFTLTPSVSVDAVLMPPTPQSIGTIVRVPVNVSNVNNISLFTIQMSYWGASRVWLLDVEKGPLLQGTGTQLLWGTEASTSYSTKKEALSIMTSSDNGVSGSGTLCYLKMWYHWDPTQERNDGSLLQAIREGAITVKGADAQKKDGTHATMDVRSGKWYLSVDPAPVIDCNRDGVFDVADAMVVKQMADGLVMADLHCDADQNGKIDKNDLAIMTGILTNPELADKIGLT